MFISCTILWLNILVENPQGGIIMPNIILNARLGDGCITDRGKNCFLSFTSKNLDYLEYKRNLVLEYTPTSITLGISGYTGNKDIYRFSTRVHSDINPYKYKTYTECITELTLEDLVIWYLDDGSWHKSKKTMHLYCNMLSEEEANLLADKIHSIFNIKRPAIRWDRKKDGRKFVYLYFSTYLADVFKDYVIAFLTINNINSLLYKAGQLNSPSQTIENTNIENT